MCVCVCLGVLCVFNVSVCFECKRTGWCFMAWLLYVCLCVSECCSMFVMCVVYAVMSCVCCCAVVFCLVVFVCACVCLFKCVCVVVCAFSCDVVML